MRIYDISLPISGALPVWPGDPVPRIEPVSTLEDGCGFNVSALHLGTHTGTHVDAPRHLYAAGPGVDQLSLEILIGDAWVCRLPMDAGAVTAPVLDAASIPEGTSRLLLATANERLWSHSAWSFAEDYVALSPDAAEWVVGRNIRLLGIDYLSVDPRAAADPAAHRILLSRGVVVVEGLDLRGVPEGLYTLVCLPLRLLEADGAPARAVLLSRE